VNTKNEIHKLSIAVMIPCFNEKHTIEKVVKDFRKELPDADIYVFNTSNSASPLLWSYTTGSWGMYVDISGNGKYVAAGGYEQIVYLFNTLSPDPIMNYTVGNGLDDIALSDDGNYLAVPAYDKKLYLLHNHFR